MPRVVLLLRGWLKDFYSHSQISNISLLMALDLNINCWTRLYIFVVSGNPFNMIYHKEQISFLLLFLFFLHTIFLCRRIYERAFFSPFLLCSSPKLSYDWVEKIVLGDAAMNWGEKCEIKFEGWGSKKREKMWKDIENIRIQKVREWKYLRSLLSLRQRIFSLFSRFGACA